MLLPVAVALVLTAPAVSADDPPVQVWIDPDRSLVQGDRVRVHVRTAQDAYVVVLRVDGEGRVRVLFPLDPGEDDFVRGGRNVEVRGRSDREAFFVDEQNGTGVVLAAAAKSPFTFDAFVRGDHWDYRVLASDQARNDPEAALLDIVRRVAGDQHFDYDVVNYTVGNVAMQPYGHRPYGYGGYGYGGYGFGLGFGRPYYYCDPFFDGFCDPFFYGYGYDPFYYGGYGYGYCWWCAPRVFVYSPRFYRPSSHPGFLARFRQTRPASPPFVLPSNPVTRRNPPPPAVVTRPPIVEAPRDVRPVDRPPERRAPRGDARPADRPPERRAPPDRAAPRNEGRSNGGQARPRSEPRSHMFSAPWSFSRPSFGGGGGGGFLRSMTRSGGEGGVSRSSGGGGRRR